MRITVLIAKFDDRPGEDGIAFAPNCELEFGDTIPVVRSFASSRPPIGCVRRVMRQGPDLLAELELWGLGLVGTYPACGLEAVAWDESATPRRRVISKCRLIAVSLCDQPNADRRIPAIGMVS